MSDDHDKRGRFRKGNQARRRRQRVLSPYQLAQLVDQKLAKMSSLDRTLEDLIAGLVCKLVAAASKGDLDAARWLIDRFAPPERLPRVSIGRLPKPSEKPLEFLDKIAVAVASGKLSVDDAAKLSRLAAPMVADQQLSEALAQLKHLEEKVSAMTAPKLRAV